MAKKDSHTNAIENIRKHHQDPKYLAERGSDRQDAIKKIQQKYEKLRGS